MSPMNRLLYAPTSPYAGHEEHLSYSSASTLRTSQSQRWSRSSLDEHGYVQPAPFGQDAVHPHPHDRYHPLSE